MTTSQRVNKLKAALQGMQANDTTAEIVQLTTQAPQATKYPVAPSRVGKRMISGYFNPECIKQMHLLSIERDATVQGLLEEALNDLFRKYGKSAIA